VTHRDVVQRAIRERRPLALEYRYPGQGLRTVHPHALYRDSDGVLYLNAYQVSGYTSRLRSLPGWRSFDLSQVVAAELLDGTFPLAPGFNSAATQYGDGVVASP
jgi:predicted DNA-binding transcriptional regulator YafY